MKPDWGPEARISQRVIFSEESDKRRYVVIEDACGDVTGRSPNLDRSGRCGKKKVGATAVSSPCGESFWARLGATWVKQKIDKMYSESVPKSVPGGVLEGSKRGSGGVPGWSWRGPRAKLGRSSLLEPTWGPSWSQLGPSWRLLGLLLSPLELP